MKAKILAAILVAFAFCAAGCPLASYTWKEDGEGVKFLVAPQTIPSGGVLGGVLSTLGIAFPFDQVIPGRARTSDDVDHIYVKTIALRTVIAADFDSQGKLNEGRLYDSGLIFDCENNKRPTVDFVKTLEILIQSRSAGSKAVRIAHFTNKHAGDCGFMMEPDMDPATGKAYDLIQFLPDYTVTSKATGSPPPSDLKLGGYVAVDFTGRGQFPLPEKK